MVKKKKTSEKKKEIKKKSHAKRVDLKKFPTLNFKDEEDIAMDFAIKVYKRFNKIIKTVSLFGSAVKKETSTGSDIDILIIIDDASINWDQKLILWYREELNKILSENPYKKEIHITTIKLTTWWRDLIKGDPTVINIIRYGKPLIDLAGFFEPLQYLLVKGEIKPSPETIYNCLQRAPLHFSRSKLAELNAIEGLYWAMVDSAHAALIAKGIVPPSPEHILEYLKTEFVDAGKLNVSHATNYRDLYILHKEIAHGKITELRGVDIDKWQDKTRTFMQEMNRLVKELI